MSVKQPSLRGLAAWFVVLAIFLGFIFGAATPLNAGAKRQLGHGDGNTFSG